MKNYERLNTYTKKIERRRFLELLFGKSKLTTFIWGCLESEIDEEIWRPTYVYGDYYEVSNRGRVRSVDRIVENKAVSGGYQRRRGWILKQSMNGRGYLPTAP